MQCHIRSLINQSDLKKCLSLSLMQNARVAIGLIFGEKGACGGCV
ncbi:hypothetical protein D1AOALGA4SA_10505 [Olavius algarvensis Delta 1 endosymbiont]|nr:hypothetical protein D1AOALGA4SA_10505 [Olavius algarvensis Delta 1 endosymbiont]